MKDLFSTRTLPVIIPLLLSLLIWINPSFFSPGTYMNLGDTVFPLSPERFLKGSFSAWYSHELGTPNLYPIVFVFYLPLYLLSWCHVPLWVINRLWMIIPTGMVGWGSYYLYRSIFCGKHSKKAGMIAAIFAMLPPDYAVCPLWYVSLAGCAFSLGVWVRILYWEKVSRSYPLLMSLGVLCMTPNPRVLYLFAICFLCYTVISIKQLRQKGIHKTLLYTGISVFLGNAFWLIPLLGYEMAGRSALTTVLSSESYGKGIHLNMLLQYIEWTNPLWICRLMISGPFAGADYIKQNFIYPFTFIMPFYAFSSFLFIRKNKKFTPLKTIGLLFVIAAFSLYFPGTRKVYLYLWENLPGFVVLNSPRYWFLVLGILYAVFTGATTQFLLLKIDNSLLLFPTSRWRSTAKTSLIGLLTILMCLVYGGSLLIGISPKTNVWGNAIYGNHLPAARVPDEYFKLGEYLVSNASNGDRLLNIPWVRGGYAAYTWWNRYTMPEVISTLSPIPILGASAFPSNSTIGAIGSLREGQPEAATMLRRLGVKFVLLHKDYQRVETVFNPENYEAFENNFAKIWDLKTVIDNRYFSLYAIEGRNTSSVYLTTDIDIDKGMGENKKESELLEFTGKNYIYLGNPESLKFTSMFTLSCWIYLDKKQHSGQGIFTKNAGSGDYKDNYGVMIDQQKIWLMINLEGSRGSTFASPSIYPNRWYHVAMVFDKNRGYSCYVNSIPIGFQPIEGSVVPSQSPVLIGGYNGPNPMHFFQGFITDVQVYAAALAYDEIRKLFLSGIRGGAVEGKDLRGWWDLGEKNIKDGIVMDLSGNNNHGELRGITKFGRVDNPSIDNILGGFSEKQRAINYEKISAAEYRVSPVNETEGPFFLVLNQAYHPLWRCYVGNNMIKDHDSTELGMNRWLIRDGADKEIRIYFAPQKWFEIGLFISSSFFCIMIIRRLWAVFKRKSSREAT